MKVAHSTDRGKVHLENDDSIQVDQERGIFLLADGMTGFQGKAASQLAVQTAYEFIQTRIAKAQGEKALKDLFADTFAHTHTVVQEASRRDRKLRGMGTTLLMLVLQGNTASIGHVGDSRAYIMREAITQLTTDHAQDHCFADEVMLRGLFFPSQHRILAQAIGASKKIDPQTIHAKLHTRDLLLLCSDGLTDMLSDETIKEIIKIYCDDLKGAADSLVEAANRMGGKDNISVILIRP